ncbi:uncharacterized protein LOC131962245 [Centropristis striata]|uniref:uncharacterized protein LOC131962245 n=1 Tax=Centropristis striata TaxID=184440 RepID=UPI0027E02578|nr:uncharacterized protein LOC131962245 [Centropristis striata]
MLLCCRNTSEQQKAVMAKIRYRDFWTDDEVELLLKVTHEYKEAKAAENVDWESLPSKYVDIFEEYRKHYPSPEEAMGMENEYPHTIAEISRAQLTTKVKAIRNRFRHAVSAGTRNGHGRVILLYFELCESIWGSSPASPAISKAIQTREVKAETVVSVNSSPEAVSSSVPGGDAVAEAAEAAEAAEGAVSAETVENRRQRLHASLGGYRRKKFKRKLSRESIAMEDLNIKRRLLQRLETTHNEFVQTMGQMSAAMDRLNSNIEKLVQHIVSSGPTNSTPCYIWGVKNGEMSLVHECHSESKH